MSLILAPIGMLRGIRKFWVRAAEWRLNAATRGVALGLAIWFTLPAACNQGSSMPSDMVDETEENPTEEMPVEDPGDAADGHDHGTDGSMTTQPVGACCSGASDRLSVTCTDVESQDPCDAMNGVLQVGIFCGDAEFECQVGACCSTALNFGLTVCQILSQEDCLMIGAQDAFESQFHQGAGCCDDEVVSACGTAGQCIR